MTRLAKLLIAAAVFVALTLSGPAASATVVHGDAADPLVPALGTMKYLGNPEGYMLWVAPTANVGPYVAGHTYLVVHKFGDVRGKNWCGPVVQTGTSDRPPYSLANPGDEVAWYKIIDTTTGELVLPAAPGQTC